MRQMIECVPNFSEGRNPAIVQALIAAVKAVPDVWLLDHTMDADHHRSVFTFVGSPDAVGEAALRAITVATELIDLRRHEGVHPRVGATDVVPFVPIQGVTMEECAQLARRLGQQVGSELGIPVFLYEQASPAHDFRSLESIRLGGLEGLASRMEANPAWLPDFGPPRLHETAGAIVIGARQPLIAFNVNLKTSDLAVAKAIAKIIRQSSGGFPHLKAIGVKLASRGMVQVAMNLTDYRVTSMYSAFQAVKAETMKHGVPIAGCELVGLVPQAALDHTAAASLQFERFDPAQVLETKMRVIERDQSLSDFLEAVADAKPTPAGGSVAALVGALAASLSAMGARLGHQTDAQQQLRQWSTRLHALIHADIEAYQKALLAKTASNAQPGKSTELAGAWREATEIPLEIAETACHVGKVILSCFKTVQPSVHSDLVVALIMAIAAGEAGLHTVRANFKTLTNQPLNNVLLPRITKAERCLEELKGLCYTRAPGT